MNDPALGLGAEFPHQPIEIDAAQVLHGIIKQPFRRASVIINRDGVWMGELAGHLGLLLETRRAGVIGHFRAKEFDGHGPAQQGMPGAINHAVGALSNLVDQDVLPKTPRRERAFLHRSPQPVNQKREGEDGYAAEHQQEKQYQEHSSQHIESLECFVDPDFGRHAHSIFRQPGPGAYHLRTPIITIAFHVVAILPSDCGRSHPSQMKIVDPTAANSE